MTRDAAFRGGIVVALIATAWASRPSTAPVASPLAAVIPAAAPTASLAARAPAASRTPVRPTTEAPVPTVAPARTAQHRKEAATPTPTRQPGAAVTGSGLHLSGIASWYCSARSACTAGYPAGCLCAAASATLRTALGAGWRGARIRVSRGAAAVTVALVDTCGCPGGRLVDLYAAAFGRLAPLGAGVARVEVQQ